MAIPDGGKIPLPDGTYLYPKYKIMWVEGSETCKETEARKRVVVLQSIVDKHYDGKRYRNIYIEKDNRTCNGKSFSEA